MSLDYLSGKNSRKYFNDGNSSKSELKSLIDSNTFEDDTHENLMHRNLIKFQNQKLQNPEFRMSKLRSLELEVEDIDEQVNFSNSISNLVSLSKKINFLISQRDPFLEVKSDIFDINDGRSPISHKRELSGFNDASPYPNGPSINTFTDFFENNGSLEIILEESEYLEEDNSSHNQSKSREEIKNPNLYPQCNESFGNSSKSSSKRQDRMMEASEATKSNKNIIIRKINLESRSTPFIELGRGLNSNMSCFNPKSNQSIRRNKECINGEKLSQENENEEDQDNNELNNCNDEKEEEQISLNSGRKNSSVHKQQKKLLDESSISSEISNKINQDDIMAHIESEDSSANKTLFNTTTFTPVDINSKSKKKCCIIHPTNFLKKRWDNYIALLIVSTNPIFFSKK